VNYFPFILTGLLALPAFFFQTALGQQPVEEDDIAKPDALEEFVEENEDAEFGYDTYLEELSHYQEHPINLNRATHQELLDLGLLTEIQIVALLRHIDRQGRLLNIYELQAVEHFDLETIRQILPYVTVKGEIDDVAESFGKMLSGGKFQFFLRSTWVLEEQKGYTDPDTSYKYITDENGTITDTQTVLSSRYKGSPMKLYARFRYNYGTHVYYGITAEKDAGEAFFKGSQMQGFDFYSAHFFLHDFKRFESLALGDYAVNIGQGLMLWQGYSTGKSAYVMSVKKEGRPLKPYSSVNEALFLRGAGATVRAADHWYITAFGSYKGIDANVSQTDTLTEEVTAVTSFLESGFHRTENELDDKKAINQMIVGGNIAYRKRTWRVSASAVHYAFDAQLNRNLRLYNQFEFSSARLTNFGIDYSWVVKNIHLFGETAMSDNGSLATLNGLLASLDPRVDVSIVHRYFQHAYQSLFSNPFAETSKPANEHGAYAGISVRPIRHWKLNGYVDVYRHPWMRFRADAPSHGIDLLAQVTYKPSRQLEMYLRYKNEVKQQNAPDDEAVMDYLSRHERGYVRYHVKYKVSERVTMKNRVEVSFFDNQLEDREVGYLVYHDVNFKPLSFPLSFSARFALFETPSYDARFYAYENDVLYAFSIPPYFDKGFRYYLSLRYKAFYNLDLYFRFAQTYYPDREAISSGLNEIQGHAKSEIKAMLRLKF